MSMDLPSESEASRLCRFALRILTESWLCKVCLSPKPLGRLETGCFALGCRPDNCGIENVAIAYLRSAQFERERDWRIGKVWVGLVFSLLIDRTLESLPRKRGAG